MVMVITGAGLPMVAGIRMAAIMVIAVMNVISLRASAGRLLGGVAAGMGDAMEGKRHRSHQHDAGGQAPYVMPQSVHEQFPWSKGPYQALVSGALIHRDEQPAWTLPLL